MYPLIVVGLDITVWPGIISPPPNLSHMDSVVRSVLGAVALLALLGIRYPLKMPLLLFFELIWKCIWRQPERALEITSSGWTTRTANESNTDLGHYQELRRKCSTRGSQPQQDLPR